MNLKFFPFEQKSYVFSMLDMKIAHEFAVENKSESIFFFEHPDLYSAGKSFKHSEFLNKINKPIYFSDRGGKITVHSRGQIVVYPIINLKRRNLTISEFVAILEDWMIQVLNFLGISAKTTNLGRGVFIDNDKIGFIGINVSKGVSKHGLCLNISNDISLFQNIVPCGLEAVNITSIEKLTGVSFETNFISDIFKKFSPF